MATRSAPPPPLPTQLPPLPYQQPKAAPHLRSRCNILLLALSLTMNSVFMKTCAGHVNDLYRSCTAVFLCLQRPCMTHRNRY